LGFALTFAGCAQHEGIQHREVPGRASSALLTPELTPVPCKNGANIWAGKTTSELLFADAVVECSNKVPPDMANPTGTFWDLGLNGKGDEYIRVVLNDIQHTLTTYLGPGTMVGDAGAQWYQMRSNTAALCDPVTLAPSSTPLMTPSDLVMIKGGDPNTGCCDYQTLAMDNDIRTASVNLCVAQKLRRLMPGSAGGESLLFPAFEQREFLETIRERSQIAMLQYALLGEIFAANIQTPGKSPGQTAGVIHQWAQQNPTIVANMGGDFAAAVQLNHTVTQEVAQLLARSRQSDKSASLPSASLPDQYWGTASWQQRAMAMAFGGDPLIVGSNGAWPQVLSPVVPGTYTNTDWPVYSQAPYVKASADSPQVHELWQFAKQFGGVDLALQTTTSNLGSTTTTSVDINATATNIYNNVEINVRVAQCYPTPSPGAACPTTATATATLPYLLETKYGITMEHAKELASLLADEAFLPQTGGVGIAIREPEPFSTGLDIADDDPSGQDVTIKTSGSVSSPSVHLSSKIQFQRRTLNETAPIYAAIAPLRFPTTTEVSTDADSGSLALSGLCGMEVGLCNSTFANDANEGKRILGALAANNATREMLLDALNYGAGATGWAAPYFAHASQIIETINGVAGTDGFSLDPNVSVTFPGTPPANTTPVLQQVPPNMWHVTITHDAQDTFWSMSPAYTVYALRGANLANLAAHPEVQWYGDSLDAEVALAYNAGQYAIITQTDAATFGETRAISSQLQLSPTVGLHNTPIQSAHYTFIVVAATPGATIKSTTPGTFLPYKLLAANTLIQNSTPHYGVSMAYGGSLGQWMAHQSQPNPENPSEPAYDGFDLPMHWVPPFSAQVLGGNPGDSIVQSYLSLSQQAADNATKAVQTALDDLQMESLGQATAAASALAVQQTQDELCGMNGGSSNTSCDVGFQTVTPSTSWGYPNIGPPMGMSTDIKVQVDQFVYTLVSSLYGTKVAVANAVLAHISESSAPSFPEYAGGSLQQAFITQWGALRDPIGKIIALQNQANTVKAQIDAASEALQDADDAVKFAAGPGLALAMASCVSIGFPPSANMGPMVAQMNRIMDLMNQEDKAANDLIIAQANAFGALASAGQDFANSAAAMAQSGAAIQALILRARDAKATNALEVQLSVAGQQTSFGLFREYRSADVWRAKALVENARVYALAARRAIEARYVVDLSRLTQPEAFVVSPASWADSIYTYDLSMPSAVGLAVPDSATQTQSQGSNGNSIYTNEIADYVGNLQGFVSGYAVSRPAAVAQSELDVISLAGLAPGSAVSACVNETVATGTCESPMQPLCSDHPGTMVSSCTDSQGGGYALSCCQATPAYPALGDWALHCPGNGSGGAWIPVPVQPTAMQAKTDFVDNACAVAGKAGPARPDMARLEFNLDPWGRVSGSTANPPNQKNFNGRWTQLAVNFVGTGIKNCMLAADPQGCYSEEFIPYNLTHAGPAWLTDYDEIWRQLDVPTGQIEAAKGLAAEIWLDPLQNGWSTQFISAIARTEFELRPLGGAYVLEFPVGPEVMLNQIQRIQILVGSTAWVKQQ
jgi:hypothetical protein